MEENFIKNKLAFSEIGSTNDRARELEYDADYYDVIPNFVKR